MHLKKTGSFSLILTILLLAMLISACNPAEEELQLADLSADEHTYVSRLIILERAKAIALNDRELGNTVLDSLAQAWGDSAQYRTADLAPVQPRRSQAVHDLLKRIVQSEKDSLILSPTLQRLRAPLLDPQVESLDTPGEPATAHQ